jgi:hypothetical protein
MTRRFSLKDSDWGTLEIFVIHENPTTLEWESEWDCFRTEEILKPVSNLFTKPSYNAYQDALRGSPMSLIKELGLTPKSCFLKTPQAFLQCFHKSQCAMYKKNICLANAKPPECFQASVEKNEDLGIKLSYIFSLWRDGIYVLIAPSDNPLDV